VNLEKLFSLQRELDNRIIKEKDLEGQDLLPNKILALQVELGELANEWRGFKFWSENQNPRTEKVKHVWEEGKHGPYFVTTNPLLEEYVDCLHFILSIGLEEKSISRVQSHFTPLKFNNVTFQFLNIFQYTSEFLIERKQTRYELMFASFIGLGEMLGFTWEQIEQAYLDKNKVNHERQDNGY
jgi:dimeric dUTPase (all-alpha-NTP-PPase superfamily)